MIALLLSTALAIEVEGAVEVGSLHNGDEAYDLFSRGNALPSAGLRVGVRPTGDTHVPVGFIATWHHNTRGSRVFAEDEGGGRGFTSAFTTDTFALGAKVDADIGGVFAPYVTAQGLVMRGLARFDDDLSVNDNPGQVSVAGVAPGVLAMGGVELSNPRFGSLPFEVTWHLEVGYGFVGRMDLDTLGSMQPGGVVVRSGLGVRWGRQHQ